MTRRSPNPIRVPVRNRIETLLDAAITAQRTGDPGAAWRHLEDAHVLSQPWIRPHLRVHIAMLSLAWAQRDRAEIVGQVVRMALAGPGSATGHYPAGNTGRANVSAFAPMPVRDDLARLLDDDTDSQIDADDAGGETTVRVR